MCLRRAADLHMAQLMPMPLTFSCSSKSRLVHLPYGYYFSGAGSSSSGQNPEGHKMVVVAVVVVIVILVVVVVVSVVVVVFRRLFYGLYEKCSRCTYFTV